MTAGLHDGIDEEEAGVGEPDPGPLGLACARDDVLAGHGCCGCHGLLQSSLRRAGCDVGIRLCILLSAVEDDAADAEHDQGEADECIPMGGEGNGVSVVEDAEHKLREMVCGQERSDALQPVGHELDGNPEAAEEGHGQVDEVDDAGCCVCGDE